MKFVIHIADNIALYLVLIITGIIFYFHFDYSTLGSWDEAWYGSIAREMVRRGDWLHMIWNGKPFADHPPMGMWAIAGSYLIFGISEFSTRLPSVLAGISTTFFVFNIVLFLSSSKRAGFHAALILATCVWYLLRVRSGNLDALFVCFYSATVYFSLKTTKSVVWFPVAMLFFAFLMLTKTLVGISAGPLIAMCAIVHIRSWRRSILWYLFGVVLFSAVVVPWYYTNWYWYPDFYQHHFLTIGTRDKTFDSYFHLKAAQPLFFLHMGIRKWYWIWIATVAYFIVIGRWIKKEIAFLLLWNFLVLYPFLTSEQTQLWHLIPVYLPISIVIAVGLHDIVSLYGTGARSIADKSKPAKMLLLLPPVVMHSVTSICVLIVVFLQFKTFKNEVYQWDRYTPDDVAIAQKASKYTDTIYLDDDYLPLAVFYSGHFMRQMSYEPEERKTLVNLFRSPEKNFVVITRNWALSNLKNEKIAYRLLEANNSFSIVTRK